MKLKTSIVGLLLVILAAAAAVDAQKPKTGRKTGNTTALIDEMVQAVPEIRDFAFVVEVDKNAGVTVRVQKTELDKTLGDAASNQNLTEFFTAFAALKNGQSKAAPLDPITIVRADAALGFGQVVEVVKALRVSPRQKIKLEVGSGQYVMIPALPDQNMTIRPNPNFLLVDLRSDSKLYLNNEEHGSFENPAPLKDTLREVFQNREKNGVFRPGANEVEKTVYVKAPVSARFGDVVRLIQEVITAGATPIGLQIDDLSPAPVLPVN
ncbi:MAG: hypothetical protein JSS81_08145 [Acidobacteria bacterium]|nr:hypothetical protein [Acidobacteriota bacterium]